MTISLRSYSKNEMGARRSIADRQYVVRADRFGFDEVCRERSVHVLANVLTSHRWARWCLSASLCPARRRECCAAHPGPHFLVLGSSGVLLSGVRERDGRGVEFVNCELTPRHLKTQPCFSIRSDARRERSLFRFAHLLSESRFRVSREHTMEHSGLSATC